MATKSLSKILKTTSEIAGKEEKIKYLRDNMTRPLAILIEMAYRGDTVWNLPEGDPPYKPSEYDNPGALIKEVRRLYMFVDDNQPNLHKIKRERLFIDILEFVDKDDAVLLLGVKNGKLPYNRLTKKFMQEALPELFYEKVS